MMRDAAGAYGSPARTTCRVSGATLRAARLAASALIAAGLWAGAPAVGPPGPPDRPGQTCTNSIFLTGGNLNSGLFDNGVAQGLTVTNTNAGTISGTGEGIFAKTVTVTNNGTISGAGSDPAVIGIQANTATVTNNG